ncbi:hypothetical protein GUJ93_ZPchr0004g39637 [Zizania palustris]|uniref:Gnk2-homologous domain-containing protein n=1 Tax=Zizania palustris TaxID=103762 RepID=A0A8J5SM94_ZIZPA|nr:hypothetical protein GUJ93_ZPchr0004g39637 [Zizania palustris]
MHQRDRLCCSVVAAAAAAVLAMLGASTAPRGGHRHVHLRRCSPSKYQPGTPFEGNLESLLTSFANSAPNGGYNSFTAGSNGTGDGALAAYGCTSAAATWETTIAPRACGTPWRSSTSNFLGQPDTAMVYRKCSISTSSDGDFLKNRDAVLSALQGAANGYNVSSSGSVQGVSQCLGEIPAADCTTCLAQAVGQLKGTCGTALAADVYLAQCYVRYWANGYYFRPSQGP